MGKIESAWENYLWTAANPLLVFEALRKRIDQFKWRSEVIPTLNFIMLFCFVFAFGVFFCTCREMHSNAQLCFGITTTFIMSFLSFSRFFWNVYFLCPCGLLTSYIRDESGLLTALRAKYYFNCSLQLFWMVSLGKVANAFNSIGWFLVVQEYHSGAVLGMSLSPFILVPIRGSHFSAPCCSSHSFSSGHGDCQVWYWVFWALFYRKLRKAIGWGKNEISKINSVLRAWSTDDPV